MPSARLFLVRHAESEVDAHATPLVGGRSSWAELRRSDTAHL